MSGERNVRAKRFLARRVAAREDWVNVVEYWMDVFKINLLFLDGWFFGGYVCLKCD